MSGWQRGRSVSMFSIFPGVKKMLDLRPAFAVFHHQVMLSPSSKIEMLKAAANRKNGIAAYRNDSKGSSAEAANGVGTCGNAHIRRHSSH